jgi:DNA-binding IclR family transcriptional regulator
MGRIMLAHMPSDQVAALYRGRPLERITEKTPATLEALLAQCAMDRAAGIAWSDSNYEAGIASAAAVIFDRFGSVVGALNVTGPSASFVTPANRRAEVGEAVRAAAGAISSRLGYTTRGDIHNTRRMQ